MKKQRAIAGALILIGAIMTVGGSYQRWIRPLVTAYADDTPPEVIPIIPEDGAVYMEFNYIYVEIVEDESVVTTCKNGPYEDGVWIFLDDYADPFMLYNAHGGKPYGTWGTHYHPGSTKKVGTHSFKVVATNNVGLHTEVSGIYTVYGSLNGTWSVNGIDVTSKDQVLRLSTRTLTFQFTKTEGLDDSSISCVVDWNKAENPEKGSMELNYVGDGTWSGSRTFVGGKYTIDLIASDGMGVVQLTLYGLDLGGSGINLDDTLLVGGVILIVIGVIVFLKRTHSSD